MPPALGLEGASLEQAGRERGAVLGGKGKLRKVNTDWRLRTTENMKGLWKD